MSEADRQASAPLQADSELEPLIAALRTASTALLQDLDGATQALEKEGRLPSQTLASSTASLRQSFAAVWSRLEEHANDTGVEVEPLGDDLSLDAMEDLAQRIETAYAELRALRLQAMTIVTRVLQLKPESDAAASLIEPLQDEARMLAEDLEGESTVERSRLEAWTSSAQPLAALLELADSAAELDDPHWEAHRASVAEGFGTNVATAVARGRIVLQPPEPAAPTPGPDAAGVTPPPDTPDPRAAEPDPMPDREPRPELVESEDVADAPDAGPEATAPSPESKPRRWRRRRR